MNDIWSFGTEVFTDGLLYFILHGLFAWLIAYMIYHTIRHATSTLVNLKGTKSEMAARYLLNTIKVLIYGVALFVVLQQVKPLKVISNAVLGASSILAVIVGLAAQKTFGNYISGVMLTIHQPFQIGDLITLKEKGITGWVSELTFRHTVLRTAENTTVIVPNSEMDDAVVEDFSALEKTYCSYQTVSVGYDTDIDAARRIIQETVSSQPGFADPRTPEQKAAGKPAVDVQVSDFLASGIQLKYTVNMNTYLESFAMLSDIREALLKKFRANGIVIPYPTRMNLYPEAKKKEE